MANKLNTEKAIRKEIADCDKQVKKCEQYQSIQAANHHAAWSERINYLSGYRDALVRVLVDMDTFLPPDKKELAKMHRLLAENGV